MADPVRVALIGCGRIAQVAHLTAVEKGRGRRARGGERPGPGRDGAEAVARRYEGVTAYGDPTAIWDDPSIEAVVIVAPDRFHCELTRQALEAGKHALVEVSEDPLPLPGLLTPVLRRSP